MIDTDNEVGTTGRLNITIIERIRLVCPIGGFHDHELNGLVIIERLVGEKTALNAFFPSILRNSPQRVGPQVKVGPVNAVLEARDVDTENEFAKRKGVGTFDGVGVPHSELDALAIHHTLAYAFFMPVYPSANKRLTARQIQPPVTIGLKVSELTRIDAVAPCHGAIGQQTIVPHTSIMGASGSDFHTVTIGDKRLIHLSIKRAAVRITDGIAGDDQRFTRRNAAMPYQSHCQHPDSQSCQQKGDVLLFLHFTSFSFTSPVPFCHGEYRCPWTGVCS